MKERIIKDILEYPELQRSINLWSFILFLEFEKEITLEYIDNTRIKEVIDYFKQFDHIYTETLRLSNHETIVFFSYNKQKLFNILGLFSRYILWDSSLVKEIGYMLWFPQCCVKSFESFFSEIPFDQLYLYQYNFFKFKTLENYKISKYLDIFYDKNRLIFHTPCSFLCKESIFLAQKTEKYLSKYWISQKLSHEDIYDILLFPNNEYFVFYKQKYISFWVYYEYNHEGDNILTVHIKKILTSNLTKLYIHKDKVYIQYQGNIFPIKQVLYFRFWLDEYTTRV